MLCCAFMTAVMKIVMKLMFTLLGGCSEDINCFVRKFNLKTRIVVTLQFMFSFNKIVMKRMVGMCLSRWSGVVEILAKATEFGEHFLAVWHNGSNTNRFRGLNISSTLCIAGNIYMTYFNADLTSYLLPKFNENKYGFQVIVALWRRLETF